MIYCAHCETPRRSGVECLDCGSSFAYLLSSTQEKRHRGLPAALQRICPVCKQREVWVLDCDLSVECPAGITDGVHVHFSCGRCGHEYTEKYED